MIKVGPENKRSGQPAAILKRDHFNTNQKTKCRLSQCEMPKL